MATHRGTVVKVSSKGANQQQFKNVIRFTKLTLEDGTTIKVLGKGYLEKKAKEGRGKWLKRWWELRGPFLMYWYSKQKAETKIQGQVNTPAGAIDLNFVTAIRTGNNGERLEKRGRSESSWLVDWLVGWLIDRLIDR